MARRSRRNAIARGELVEEDPAPPEEQQQPPVAPLPPAWPPHAPLEEGQQGEEDEFAQTTTPLSPALSTGAAAAPDEDEENSGITMRWWLTSGVFGKGALGAAVAFKQSHNKQAHNKQAPPDDMAEQHKVRRGIGWRMVTGGSINPSYHLPYQHNKPTQHPQAAVAFVETELDDPEALDGLDVLQARVEPIIEYMKGWYANQEVRRSSRGCRRHVCESRRVVVYSHTHTTHTPHHNVGNGGGGGGGWDHWGRRWKRWTWARRRAWWWWPQTQPPRRWDHRWPRRPCPRRRGGGR